MKTVVYDGYEFRVPASWPVYRLDEHPRICVRYDVSAVYLGTPGTDMECPAGLVGRAQTVSFIPGRNHAAGTGARSPGRPRQAAGTELPAMPAVHGAITRNAARRDLAVGLGATALGATVLGTYGSDPAVVQQVLNTLHQAPAGTAPTAQSASAQSASAQSASAQSASAQSAPGRADSAETSSGTRRAQLTSVVAPAVPRRAPAPARGGASTDWPTQIAPPQQPKTVHPVGGFDACTAPSLKTMRVWRSDYAASGVYIGGANAACASGNLSAGWVRATEGMNWALLPTYVGPQAPCWSGQGVLINAGSAAAEGRAAAADAVSDARTFGFGRGSPIYYDMEGYVGGTSCKDAVLTFLGAWDRQVAAAGYVTAVYASQSSGITDMQQADKKKMAGFTPPDAVWIALWDNKPSLADGSLAWPRSDRDKQYAGNVYGIFGGITLSIDKDVVAGPVGTVYRGRVNRFARTAVDS